MATRAAIRSASGVPPVPLVRLVERLRHRLYCIHQRLAPPPVVMITAHGNERTAVEAIKAGAYDYLAKPFEVDELRLVVKNALETSGLREENERLKAELKAVRGVGDLLGASDRMRRIYDLINKVAATDVTVLIHGESGTGKELVARAIHEQSAHRRGDFIAMNCAALPSELIESELFGHEKGAFTGAAGQRKGKFELANGGTIFLDEIGDTTPAIQVKLLRVIQEREFRRVGGTQDVKVDVRIIAATNRDLEKAVAEPPRWNTSAFKFAGRRVEGEQRPRRLPAASFRNFRVLTDSRRRRIGKLPPSG